MLVGLLVNRAAFERRWRADVAHAEATLLKDRALAPLFVIVAHDGRTLLIPADFSSAKAKQHAITMVRLAAVASDAELALLRCESWVVVGPELAPGVTPATSDRRVEAVAVLAAARIGRVIARRASLREIVRGADGRPAALRDITAPAGLEQFEGAMLDILPPRRPTREQQELAAALLAAERLAANRRSPRHGGLTDMGSGVVKCLSGREGAALTCRATSAFAKRRRAQHICRYASTRTPRWGTQTRMKHLAIRRSTSEEESRSDNKLRACDSRSCRSRR